MADATNAIKAGEALSAKVKAAGDLTGLELDEAIKLLTVEVNETTISVVLKSKLRDILGEYSKTVIAWKKEVAAARSGDIALELIAAAEKTEGDKFVIRVDFGLDGKLAKTIQNTYSKTIQDKACLLVTADDSSDRFMVIAFAPKSMTSVDCKAWVAAATEGTGGKGGGKKDSAQFTVKNVTFIESVMEKAKAF